MPRTLPALRWCFVLVLLAVAAPARGASLYWDTNTTGPWATASNWTTDSTGNTVVGSARPLASDLVFFNGSAINGATTVQLTQAEAALGITFQNTFTTTLQSSSSTTQTLTIGTGGITVSAGAGAVTLGNGTNGMTVALTGGTQTWTNNSSNTLTVVNTLALGANPLTLGGTGSYTLGVISGSVASGTTALTIGTGAGSGTTVNLGTAASTFTGDIVVNGGTLTSSMAGGAATSPLGGQISTLYRKLTLQNGGTYVTNVSWNDNVPSATNVGIIFNIGTGGGTLSVGSGLTLTIDDGTLNDTSTASTGQQLQGSGALTKTGIGTLILRQQYQFSGTITVSAGTLQLTGANGLGTNAGGTTIQTGAALDLNGTAGGDTDVVTISGTGLAATPRGAITNSSATASSYAGTITLSGASTIGTAAAGGLTITANPIGGTGDLTLAATSSGVITLGAVNITGSITNNGTGSATNVISGVIGASVTGVTQNSATSALTLSGANLYTTPTTISAGTLNANAAGALPSGSAVALNAGTLNLNATGAAAGTITVTGGTVSSSAAGAANTVPLLLNGGILTSPLAGGQFGTVTGSSSAATINPGGVYTQGPLTIANLTTGSGTTLAFDVSSPYPTGTPATTGDLLTVTGTLAIAANTPLVFNGGSPSLAGNYRLLAYTGSPAFGNLVLPTVPRVGLTYSLDTASDPGFLDFKVVGSAANVTANWIPTAAGPFSYSSGTNWAGGVVPNVGGDTAVFNTALATGQSVTLDGTVHVGSLTLNPSTTFAYTISTGTAGSSLYFDNLGTTATLNNAAQNNTISATIGLVSPGTNVTVASGTTLTLSGAIVGPGKLELFSGTGTLTLSGTNTFTGGLQIDTGTVRVTADANLGATTNVITLNGGTLGTGGTTTSVTFNAARVINFAAASTIDIPTAAGTLTSGANPSSAKFLTSAANQLTGSGTITKTGNGDFQLTQPNATLTSNWIINAGVVEVQNAGALGSGTVTINSGGEITTSGVVIPNAITLNGGTLAANSNNNGGFTGTVTVGASGATFSAAQFQATPTTGAQNFFVSTLAGTGNLSVIGPASGTNVGTVTVASAGGYSGAISVGANANFGFGNSFGTNFFGSSNPIAVSGNGSLSLLSDGDGTGSTQTINFTLPTINFAAGTTGTYTIGRFGLGTTLNTAANKTFRITDGSGNAVALPLNSTGNLTLTPNNGFGLRLETQPALTATQTITVNNTQAANIVPGLTIANLAGTNFGISKAGTGTLFLTGTNSFGGSGSLISVTAGVVAFDSDGALGDSNNAITLNGTTATLRAYGGSEASPLATSRTINLANTTGTNNVIEVATGGVFMLNSAFGAANNPWTKAERGTLVINADNPSRTAAVSLTLGGLRALSSSSFGTGTITVTNIGSALQLGNGVNLGNAITLNANSSQFGGINSSGSIVAVSGSSTLSGTITQTSATQATLGANAGTTLNFTGNYVFQASNSIGFTTGAGGTINWQNTMPANGGILKWGTGTFNLTASSTGFVTALTVNGGTFSVNGAGIIGGTGAITVASGSTLEVNNSTSVVTNRLGGNRAITLTASTLHYIGGASTSNETMGTLTAGAGTDTIQVTGGGGSNVATVTFGSLASNIVNVGGFLNLQGLDTTTNIVKFSTAPTLVGGVIQRAALNGTDLATATSNGAAVSAPTYTFVGSLSDINNATGATGPGGTTAATANAQLSSGSHSFAIPGTTVNALVLNTGSAATLTGIVGSSLTVTSGNILVSGSTGNVFGTSASPNSSIILAQGTVPSAIMVNAGADLEFAATITTGSNTGLQKALGGSLNFTGKQFFTTGTGFFDINGGTVTLSAGNHTFAAGLVNVGMDPSATLDLNGTILTANAFNSSNASANPGSGGTVVNTNGTQATLVIKAASTFGGQVTGNTSLAIAANTLLINDNSFTGDLLITGGQNVLRDYGKLSSATGNIDINYGQLHLYNDGFAFDSDRINDAKAITLRGGVLAMKGRAGTYTTETVGAVTLDQGTSLLGSTNQSGSESVLTLTSLSRNAAAGATVGFTQQFYNVTGGGTTGGSSADSGLGAIGNAGRIEVTGGLSTTNNIIGGWAAGMGFFPSSGTVDTAEFASYTPNLGIGRLNTTGYAGYNGTALVASQPTFNIRMTGTALAVTAGGSRVNSLNIANSTTTAVALTFAAAGDTLNVTSGGLMVQNVIASAGATTIGTAATPGILTAGGQTPGAATDLYLYYFGNGSNLTINSKITDSPDGSAVRLVVWGGIASNTANVILANGSAGVNGPNDYSGGTVVNQATLTVGATGNLPAGGVTLNGGSLIQTSGGVIATQAVTMYGASTLTLAGNNTLTGITISNNGGTSSPTVNAGGILTLTNATPIAVTSSNINNGATITGGTLSLGATTKTFSVDGPTINSVIADPWQSTLTVASAVINTTAGAGIIKSGSGVLNLSSTASTFDGGVALTSGGLSIGGSSSPATPPSPSVQPYILSGPLGTGPLTISGGTRILSSNAANAVINPVTVLGNFEFDGATNVALNGAVALGGVSRTITVNAPQMTATLGGVISNGSIVKEGYGTLVLNNLNPFTGGVTINNGVLAGQVPANALPTASAPSPFGTAAINYTGTGILSIRGAIDATIGNDINVASGLVYVNLDTQSVGNAGAATAGNTIIMGNLNLPTSSNNPTVTQVNLTNSGGTAVSNLAFTSTSLTGNSAPGSTARLPGQYQVFNVAANTNLIFLNGGFAHNNEPLNLGAGAIVLGGVNSFSNGTTISASTSGAAPAANASTAIYGSGQTVTITGTGLTYNLLPQMNAATNFGTGAIPGATTGGLQQQVTMVAVAASNLLAAATWGNAPSSQFNGVRPNDAALDRVLTGIVTQNNLGIYTGYLSIANAGVYTFANGADDYSSLVIDGQEIARQITSGTGVQDSTRGVISLSAGQHSITYKIHTGTSTSSNSAGGGDRLLYTGPDTVIGQGANATNNNWQALSSASLSYFTGPANATNNYYNAAQINNDYVLSAGSTVTLQALGSDFNTTIKSLTFQGAGTVGATNDLATTGVGGIGFIGVTGVTAITLAGAVVNPTTANLYLIGGISDGGLGLSKTGAGTLMLNNSTSFSGAFTISAGSVMLMEANALSTGGTTVAAGASLDVNGVVSSAGRAVTLNGTGTTSQLGALYNSSATPGGVAGNVTLAASSQVYGYGDITLSGTVSSTSGLTLTKAGPDTLTLSLSNATTLLGPISIAGGVLNNGTLNGSVAGALGANTIAVSAGAVLNLNGNGIASGQTITVNGTSISNTGPNANSLGNLINSSIPLSVAVRNTVTAGNNMLLLPNTAATATIAAGVVLNTATTGVGSNTFATGGDIIITGAVSGGQALTKVGGDTVTLRGVNTFAGGPTVNYGTLSLDNAGVFNGTGGTITVNTGASFILDNIANLTQTRLNNNIAANNRALLLNGGTFTILGNSGVTAVAESINASVVTPNTSAILINQGQNYINLTDNAAASSGGITITATRVGTGLDFNSANGGTVLITGKSLGLNASGTADSANILLATAGTAGAYMNLIGNNTDQTAANLSTTQNRGIAPWIIVNDSTTATPNYNFATVDAANGIRGLKAAEIAANPGTTALTNNQNVSLSTATSTSTLFAFGAPSVNSLGFVTGGSLTINSGAIYNVQSGGVLATANATISGPGLLSSQGFPNNSTTAQVNSYYFHVMGSSVLTVNAVIGGASNVTGRSGDLNKAGAGTLVLGGSNFDISNTRINEGTLQLNNASAIYYRVTTPPASNSTTSSNNGPTLQVNALGTLDLNGFNVALNNLNSINPAGAQGSLSGGTIINNVAGTRSVTVNTTGNNTWAGNISAGAGTINFAKYGRNTDNNTGSGFLIANSNTYTGTTILGGGLTILQDLGALRGTSGVTINQAALFWNDAGSQSDPYRLGATPAAVTFNGGGFQFNGRLGESSVANLGAVTLASGASQFSTNAASMGSATVQIAGFARNLGATVNFVGSVLGDDGNVRATTAPSLYNGILGGWATTSASNPFNSGSSGEFVTYDPASGFRAIVDYKTTAGISNVAGGINQPPYGPTAFGAGNNIRVNTNGTLTMNAGANVANSMVIGSAGTTTLAFTNATDTLFIQSGGVLGSLDNLAKNIGGATAPIAANLNGYLTAGNSDATAGAGNAGYEFFLHNLSNTLTVNSQIVDNGANAVSLVTSTGTQQGPVIRLNNTNTYTGTTTINTTDLRLNSATGPAIAGSLNIVVNGGTEGTIDSGRQANGRLLFERANQLNVGATVTLNSGTANLDLNNFTQTLANLAFQNLGGMTNNSSGLAAHVRTGIGDLTLTGGVTATNLANISTIPAVIGNLTLSSGPHAFSIDPVTTAGAEAQIGFTLNASTDGAGGINKAGLGIMSITGTDLYTGPTNVNAGTLVLGGFDNQTTPARITAQLFNSQLNVGASGTVDLRGGSALIGSLTGSGSVTNSVYAVTSNNSSGNVAALTLGTDGTSTGNFSGTFTNFINGSNQTTGFGLNVTKVGTGVQILSGDNTTAQLSGNGNVNNVGTLDIQNGTVRVNGANGSLGFTAVNVKIFGSLAIDNSTTNKANRLGGALLTPLAGTPFGGVITGATETTTTTFTLTSVTGLTVGMPIFGPGLASGTITAIAGNVITTSATATNSAGATGLTLYIGVPRLVNLQGGTVLFQQGASLTNEGTATSNGVGNVTLNNGSNVWTFDTTGGTAGSTVSANAFTAGSGNLVLNAGATQTLGLAAAGTNSVNIYLNGGKNGQGSGTVSTGAAVNAIAGLTGGNFSGVGVRADIFGSDSTGSGIVTYDVFGYRVLTATEYRAFPVQPLAPGFTAVNLAGAVNASTTATTPFALNTGTTINSIRFDGAGGGVTSTGGITSATNYFNALGSLNTLTVSSGGILINGATSFTGGAISGGSAALRFTNSATVTSSSYLISTSTGDAFIKDGAGTFNANNRLLQGSTTAAGGTVVNGGTLNLLAGVNTLTVVNTAGVSSASGLTINAGTVDLNGNTQTVANVVSTNPTPGAGGTLTSTGAANLYANANSTFGGSINGGISLYKTGSNNLALTSTNGYTGITQVQGGIIILQDSGSLASTTFNLNGGQLRFENRSTSLTDNGQRISSASVVNMNSGTLMDLGGGVGNKTLTVGTVNVLQGQNEIREDAVGNVTSRVMSITNFTAPTAASGIAVHFNTGNGTLGATGANPGIVVPNTTATASSVNSGVTVIPMTNTTGLTVSQSVTGTGITAGTYITAINPGVSITLSAATTATTPTTLSFGPATINPTPTGTGGGVIPWAVSQTDQPAMWNPTINPVSGLAYGVAVPNVTGGSFATLNYQQTALTSATTGVVGSPGTELEFAL